MTMQILSYMFLSQEWFQYLLIALVLTPLKKQIRAVQNLPEGGDQEINPDMSLEKVSVLPKIYPG